MKELLYFAFAAIFAIRIWNIQFEILKLKILNESLNMLVFVFVFFSDIQYSSIVNPPNSRLAKTLSYILQYKASISAEMCTSVFEFLVVFRVGFTSTCCFTFFFLLTKVLSLSAKV